MIAGAAGVAGLALAATFSYFQQPGSADYAGDPTPPPIDDTVSSTNMNLGTLLWSGADYDTDNAAPTSNDEDAPLPDVTTHSEFVVTNWNTEARQVVRLVNVLPDGNDDLYDDVWVRITRQNPLSNPEVNGDPEFRYFGPLSGLSNIYMGNIVEGGSQTFDVEAWTANAQPDDADYHTDFTVRYGVYAGAFEEAYEETQSAG